MRKSAGLLKKRLAEMSSGVLENMQQCDSDGVRAPGKLNHGVHTAMSVKQMHH